MRHAITEAARVGVSWFAWQVALSPDISDGVHTVLHRWSFREVVQAHAALEAVAAIREDEREKARMREGSGREPWPGVGP